MNWYALHVRSNFERKTAELLEQKGIEVFAPFYQPNPRKRDRKGQLIWRALFPGYVFGSLNWETQKIPTLRTPGVIRVLSLGDEPVPIPGPEIEAVRALLAAGVARPYPFLNAMKTGKPVRLTGGPLTGVQGIIVWIRDEARVVVSIEMLHRSVSVEVEAGWVGAA